MPIVGMDQIRSGVATYTQEADTYLRERYPGIFPNGRNISNFGHNDPIDAFRHAYVSGRLAQEYDPRQAFNFGVLHEILNPNPWDEHGMDIWNNGKGVDYARDFITPRDLADRIDRGLRDGELIIRPSDAPSAPPGYPAGSFNPQPLPPNQQITQETNGYWRTALTPNPPNLSQVI